VFSSNFACTVKAAAVKTTFGSVVGCEPERGKLQALNKTNDKTNTKPIEMIFFIIPLLLKMDGI
jgi:hypothetical protein